MTKLMTKLNEFEDLIWDYINDNATTTSCRMCIEQGVEIVPDDYKGSHAKAIKRLFEDVAELFEH